MKKLKIVLAGVAIASTIGMASAERDFATIYKECGLGAMLFPNDALIAIITNVTWDLGTTAVLSNMTAPDMCKGNAATMASFIVDSHAQLEQEIAMGEGEYLASMVSLMGCEANSVAAVSVLREEFSASAVSGDYFTASDVSKSAFLYNAASTAAGVCSI